MRLYYRSAFFLARRIMANQPVGGYIPRPAARLKYARSYHKNVMRQRPLSVINRRK